nr:General odorant-binding protein 71 [Metisa plana]
MRIALVLVACTLFSECYTLKCRSDGGPREEDMKAVYMNCLKKQDGRYNGTGPRNEGSRRAQGRWMEGDEGRGERDDSMDDDYGDAHKYKYGSMNQASKRYKREKQRKEKNSGQRSQYNPNMSNRSEYGDSYRDDRNSSEKSTSTNDRKKNCALHCFLEELDMTDENGMPDRYMVNQVITKDVKSEDLKDFLQESIEECFQILYNDRGPDKCEFSKNLLTCLSEKGRSNCDDWRDDMRF